MLCVVSEDTDRVIGERRMATLRDLGSDPRVVRTDQEMLDFAGRQLDRNRQDLPFTVTYLFDDDGATARLAGSTSIAAGHPAAPPALAVGDPDPVWPVATLLRGEPALAGLDGVPFTGLPAGVGSEPPAQALIVPLARRGGARYGFLSGRAEPVPASGRRLPRVRRPRSRAPRGGDRKRSQLPGPAAPRRGARRAGSRQDHVLLQHQPRVPHPADADHGAGTGVAAPTGRRWAAGTRGAGGHQPQRTAPPATSTWPTPPGSRPRSPRLPPPRVRSPPT